MLLLLPPSEGKTAPASGAALDLETLALAEHDDVTAARRDMLAALREVSQRDDALTLLGVGASLADEVTANTHLETAPAAPGHRVFTGVLFEALDYASLTAAQRAKAREQVLVFSALFGATRLGDRLPAHRLSIGAKLPGFPGLAAWWKPTLTPALDALAADGQPIVDCRSGGYAAQWKPPASQTVTVDVFQLRGGERTVVSHFAKYTRGLVARALLQAPSRSVRTLAGVEKVVSAAGSPAGPYDWTVQVRPPHGTKPGSLQVILPEA
ncbi:MAG: peroxide stress protein YaaA [Micrococcus sp.]|nr:peroxide stress protein YaaA [Micrococcus sp.]